MSNRLPALSAHNFNMDQGIAGRSPSAASSAERILAELHALNFYYLKLLARNFSSEISVQIASDLASLSTEATEWAAQCPFSLFDMTFDDEYAWDQVFAPGCVPTREGEHVSHIDRTDFAKAVLMFAWHVLNGSDSGHVQTRLLLGLHPRIAARLARASLPQLIELGVAATRLVQPRWSNHCRFWVELVQGASERLPHKLQAVRLLGRQLLATEALRAAAVSTPHNWHYTPRRR